MHIANLLRAAVICWALCSTAQAALQVTAIAAGGQENLALASDGTVWHWGTVPARISGLGSIVAIAAGYDRNLALRADGTVWEWEGTSAPVQVKDLTEVVAVAAGAFTRLALKSDGTVWCWGWTCEAGEPSDSSHPTPVQVHGLTGIVAIAAGQAHCLVLKGDGTVWAWGHNGYGQLGNGTLGPVGWSGTTTLVQVSGLTSVTGVAAGYAHSLALKGDGTVWSWGVDGTVAAYRTTPEQVRGLDGVTAIAAGHYTSMAVSSSGTVSSWGLLGWADGSPVSQVLPNPVDGLTGIEKLAVPTFGGQHLALKNDGTVWEWGDFRLAGAVLGARVAPGRVSGPTAAKAVAAGGPGGLALAGDGTVWEWSGEPTPVQVSGLTDVVAIAMGSKPKLALKGDGTVWEWTSESTPSPVADLTGVAAIAVTEEDRVALKGDGTVWEWSGQSGPKQVSGLDHVTEVSACFEWDWWDDVPYIRKVALKSDGTVWEFAGWYAPAPVSELTGIVSAACAGDSGLALKGDGTVWQWSREPSGQLSSPKQLSGLTGIVAVAAGAAQLGTWSSYLHGLALKQDGTVWAWGDNRFGQLGDGTTISRASPVQVAGLREVVALAAAGVHTRAGTLPVSLAVKRDGTVWAWGFSQFSILDPSKPVEVIQPGAPDLEITMSHDDDFIVGDQGIYRLMIANIGWLATAGTITMTDTLPPGLTYISAFGDGWACYARDYIISCTNRGPFTPGQTSIITVTVRVEAQASPGVTNLAVIQNESDRNTVNNTIGDPTVVSAGR